MKKRLFIPAQKKSSSLIVDKIHFSNYNISDSKFEMWWILSIMVLGSILRIYQISRDSFWFDEAGVASVVYVQSIEEFINLVRSHVMAVPFDYAITWLVGQACNTEFCLRLPSAIWSILTLFLGYKFCRLIFNTQVARISLVFMALSPILIQYAQELRFYSALVFFFLFSTYWLFQAIDSNRTRIWIFSIVSLIVGIYFHIFTVLALINGWIWFVLNQHEVEGRMQVFRRLLIISIISFLGLLIAYYTFFGYSLNIHHNLLDFSPSAIHFLGTLIGLTPNYAQEISSVWSKGVLFLILELVGILFVLKNDYKSPAASLIYSMLIQVFLIFSANVLKHYAITARQFLVFIPFLSIFHAIGFIVIIDWIRNASYKYNANHRLLELLQSLLVFILLFSNVISLFNYYQSVKSLDREIADYIIQRWKPGEKIVAIPMLTAQSLNYYLVQRWEKIELLPFLRQASEDDLDKILQLDGEIYLIAPQSFDERYCEELESSNFSRSVIQSPQGNWILWER